MNLFRHQHGSSSIDRSLSFMQLILSLVALALFVVYGAVLIYYLIAWNSIPEFSKTGLHIQQSTHISVIIPARNEALHIKTCLESLEKQTYPASLFEVIVIDDHSTDHTAEIVQAISATNIHLVSLKDFIGDDQLNSYKKKAIETGIRQSKGTLIVTTDADCHLPKHWLQTIALFYEKYQPAFIAAPVVVKYKYRFIEIFQALDFMTLQGVTGASVYKKIHSMCNGANLAYEKTAFNAVNGFEGIDSLASGDDMLLMHKIYKQFPGRTMYLKSRDAIVQTESLKTIKSFLNQRIRWASKADKYDDKRITAVLAIVYLFNLILLIIPLVAIYKDISFSIFHFQLSLMRIWVALLLLKTTTELFFLLPVARFFNKASLLWLFPLMQPFHLLYTIIAGWLGKFGSYKWKDRKVT